MRYNKAYIVLERTGVNGWKGTVLDEDIKYYIHEYHLLTIRYKIRSSSCVPRLPIKRNYNYNQIFIIKHKVSPKKTPSIQKPLVIIQDNIQYNNN